MKTVLFFRPKKNDHFKEDEVIHSSHHVIPGDKPDRFFADLPHMNDVSSECEVRLTKRIDEFVSYVLNSASGTEDEIRSLKLLVTPFVGELLHAIGVNYRLISSIDKCYSEKVFAVIEWDHYRPKTMVEFVHMARKGSVVNSNIQNLLFKYVFTGLRCCYYSGNEFDM